MSLFSKKWSVPLSLNYFIILPGAYIIFKLSLRENTHTKKHSNKNIDSEVLIINTVTN